jgi:hypothetical protein
MFFLYLIFVHICNVYTCTNNLHLKGNGQTHLSFCETAQVLTNYNFDIGIRSKLAKHVDRPIQDATLKHFHKDINNIVY